jgi:hypothetical protein
LASPFVLQVQTAVDTHTVDAHFLFQIAGGRVLCTAAQHLIDYATERASVSLNGCSRQVYLTHIFHATVRLDVPTWDDPTVSAHINALYSTRSPRTPVWEAITTFMDIGSAFLRVLSQTAVLVDALREQNDGLLLALLSFSSDMMSYMDMSRVYNFLSGGKFRIYLVRSIPQVNDGISLGGHHAQQGLHQNGRPQASGQQF